MIYAAWFLAGVILASVVWAFVLGLANAARFRDEEEARSYPTLAPSLLTEEEHAELREEVREALKQPWPLVITSSPGFTIDEVAIDGAPLPPSWASGMEEE